ncbi:MAG: holo-ACP synthase [Actinomycetia bacterium]|nr:holo-ACP synthase [Actinomycetes bacterium]
MGEQTGLGVDIIEIERMQRAMERVPTMRDKLFSAEEIKYAQSKSRPTVHYALFFAAKEAVLKALGTGFSGIGWTDVEVRHKPNGRPYPALSGAAETVAQLQGVVELQLSLSYTHQVAVASAVAIRQEDRPSIREKADPKAELLQRFKEMKALLDEVEQELSVAEAETGDPKKADPGDVGSAELGADADGWSAASIGAARLSEAASGAKRPGEAGVGTVGTGEARGCSSGSAADTP